MKVVYLYIDTCIVDAFKNIVFRKLNCYKYMYVKKYVQG